MTEGSKNSGGATCDEPPEHRLVQEKDKTSQRIDQRIFIWFVGFVVPTARDSAQLFFIKFDNVHRAQSWPRKSAQSDKWKLCFL